MNCRTDMNDITQLRLQLMANGYSPIRNRDKRTFMKGWPEVEITEDEIESWSRKHKRDTATGLRIENELAAIDFDIDDKEAMDRIADRICEAFPTKLGDPNVPLLVRRGKGAKEAWFVRTDEEFGRIHSRAWTKPGEGVDDGTHRVEIFGGGSARQFGAFGPHTITDDGVVEVMYDWPERSPLDTRQSELPELTKDEFFRIADIVEEELQELGWEPVLLSKQGEDHAERVYDLTDDMLFDMLDGDTLTLAELRELVRLEPHGNHRCSASWLEGPQAVNRTRCLVTVTRTGNLAIWESAAAVTHCEASLKPKDYSVAINRLAEQTEERKAQRCNRIGPADGLTATAEKLLRSYAYCKHNGQADAVPIYATSMDDGVPLTKLRTDLLPHAQEEIGPRGGRQLVNPVDIWSRSKERKSVRGMRMRPDKPRPVYEEGGETYINIYSPPEHSAEGGSPDGGLILLEQIFPDPVERQWFTCWLAHKLRYPHIPGPAVVNVAKSFGTGRGTLADMLKRLLGPRYVQPLAFETFTGKTYQSQYNEWMATALMVVVNESSESEEGSTYQTKRNTYERLKQIVDPAPTEHEIMVKTRPNYRAMSFTSYIIATNHEDALPIPADDRRFAVLQGGRPRDEAFWKDIREWMESDANIAAFYRHLMSLDLGDYSPFALPPKTDAKAEMVEAAKSDLDRAVETALAALQTDFFVVEQLVPMVRNAAREEGLELPVVSSARLHGLVKKIVRRCCWRAGIREKANSKVSIGGRKHPVWARYEDAVKRSVSMDQGEFRRSVLRNGTLS